MTTDGATPLFNSCSSGNVACVRLILQHSASIHTTYLLASPIHEAAKKGMHIHLQEIYSYKGALYLSSYFHLSSDHRECLELLLSRGAQIDLELPDVGTPLYSACVARAAACVQLLLYSGDTSQGKITHNCCCLSFSLVLLFVCFISEF